VESTLQIVTIFSPAEYTACVASILHQKGYQGTDNSYFHYNAVDKSTLEVATLRHINDEFIIGLERGESDSGIENEENVVKTSSVEDNYFIGQWGELGEALFKQRLQKSESTSGSINNIIRSWRRSWRRHACSLAFFIEYWQQQGKTIEQLAETEELYLIIVKYISMKQDSKYVDASKIKSRNSISVILAELQRAKLDVTKQQEGTIIIKIDLGQRKFDNLEVT
ncbi:MAG: hypothetical protein EZS28_032964, partial [Streblomastix strix]